ncbi:MAG: hypothetical protein WCI74_19395, partial [Actinomycetes bacterium]
DASERVEAAAVLREGLAAMSVIRGGGEAPEAPSSPAAPIEAKVEEPEQSIAAVPQPAEVAAQEQGAPEPVADEEETAVKWDKDHRPTPAEIFEFIANNPDGVSLVDMEKHFSTPRIVLQRPVKEMCDVGNEVRRDEATGRYYAV